MAANDSLRFDFDEGCWAGTVEINARPVSIRVDGGFLEIEVGPIVERAVAKLGSAWSAIEENLVTSLLADYNESWRDAGQPELAADAFLANIALDAVDVMAQELTTLLFRDEDLFYGHAIELTIESDGSMTEATLVG